MVFLLPERYFLCLPGTSRPKISKNFFLFSTFTFLSWLASTELIDSPSPAPTAEGNGLRLWVLIGPFAQGALAIDTPSHKKKTGAKRG